jgi:membrane-bound lytic murein transglycosylase D
MTLQKQTLLTLHVLVLLTFFHTVFTGNAASDYPGAEWQKEIRTDTPLVYRSTVLAKPTADSFQKPQLLQEPQIRMNQNVAAFVKKYLQKNEEDLQKIEDRSAAAFHIIETVFQGQGIPEQLKYLAVVESDLKADARSRAGAVGAWQLMSVTARELGLKVTGKTDERRHLRKSTIAAAKYLKALYKTYGDWLLTIAAYNSGPGVVNSAIKKAGSRNFWKLQQYLSAETRGHVKRYIAIHYFFEEVGSETTLTKAENLAYAREVEHYNKLIGELSKPVDSISAIDAGANIIAETTFQK